MANVPWDAALKVINAPVPKDMFCFNTDNIITACGFSGHGIMHGPAVGGALSQRALTGRYQTIDLTRMEITRVHNNNPLPEIGIK